MPEFNDYLFKYHTRGSHVVSFVICNQEAGATSYYQYVSAEGVWYMMKAVRTDAVTVYTYTTPVSVDVTSLADGWANRATLTYDTFDEVF